jgi:dihydroorotase
MTSFSIRQPDDMHLHLRDGAMMQAVIGASAARVGRAVVMPNLQPPVTTVALAEAYHRCILSALPAGNSFTPLMTLYLTDTTPIDEIMAAKASPIIAGVKLYPAGATTHSDAGVRHLEGRDEVLAAMAEIGLPLLIHGETTDPEVDIFDREGVFIDKTLAPLCARHPNLRIIFEHITSRQAVAFVQQASENIAATVTAHHLLYQRNHMLAGGIRPHYYCLPILKRELDRQALLDAVLSGSSKFFAGTDSAPHLQSKKESACGCAGAYTACASTELYATAFDREANLEHMEIQKLFESFMSEHGARFYGLPLNQNKVTLIKQPTQLPISFMTAEGALIPLAAGETLPWSLL